MTIAEINKEMSEKEFVKDIEVTHIARIVDSWYDGYIMKLKNPIKIEGKPYKKIYMKYYDTFDTKGWLIEGIKYKHTTYDNVIINSDGSERIKKFIERLMNDNRVPA